MLRPSVPIGGRTNTFLDGKYTHIAEEGRKLIEDLRRKGQLPIELMAGHAKPSSIPRLGAASGVSLSGRGRRSRTKRVLQPPHRGTSVHPLEKRTGRAVECQKTSRSKNDITGKVRAGVSIPSPQTPLDDIHSHSEKQKR